MSLSSDLTCMTSSSDHEEEMNSVFSTSPVPELSVCFTCCDVIAGQFYKRAGKHTWHEECMRCCVCHDTLDGHDSCFVRDNNIFCRRDFANIFVVQCSSCSLPIDSGDWVRSAGQHVYHLACFSCNTCQRQLSTGEDFAIHDGRVLCRIHALNPDIENNCKQPKSKRFRTAFNDNQLTVLQRYFDIDINPSGPQLHAIGKEAGLTKKVTKVWFQNARAKLKRNNHGR